MKKTIMDWSVFLLICAGIFAGCSNEKSEERKPVNVVVQTVQNITDDQNFAYSGTMEESESTPLSFSGLGTVSRVLVNEGDFVHKGQLLAELNSESSKNAYDMALAANKQAEDAYKRLLPMYKNGNLPEIKLVEVETSLQQTKSATAMAKKNLDDCRLYATIDGIVGKKSMDPGMSGVPGMASITIVKIDKIYARVSVSENEIAFIKKGDKAKIVIAALNNAEFSGAVEEIGVMADPMAHTYKIKIAIANTGQKIKPGMICNVFLGKSNVNTCLVVPNQSILTDEHAKSYVYTVEAGQNKASKKYVTTGKLVRAGVEVLGGLQVGEQVVVAGQQKLADGLAVEILK
jgi:RND family efflux transporter MFP subunit